MPDDSGKNTEEDAIGDVTLSSSLESSSNVSGSRTLRLVIFSFRVWCSFLRDSAYLILLPLSFVLPARCFKFCCGGELGAGCTEEVGDEYGEDCLLLCGLRFFRWSLPLSYLLLLPPEDLVLVCRSSYLFFGFLSSYLL